VRACLLILLLGPRPFFRKNVWSDLLFAEKLGGGGCGGGGGCVQGSELVVARGWRRTNTKKILGVHGEVLGIVVGWYGKGHV